VVRFATPAFVLVESRLLNASLDDSFEVNHEVTKNTKSLFQRLSWTFVSS